MQPRLGIVVLLFLFTHGQVVCGQEALVDYAKDVAPILAKYCSACHNPTDLEGNFSLASFADIAKGLEHGPLLLPGQPESSRLIRVTSGLAEPAMPPDDYEKPTDAEIQVLRDWIDAGARGPDDATPLRRLLTPHIKTEDPSRAPAITTMAISPSGSQIAMGRFGVVEFWELTGGSSISTIADLPGKVHAVSFSADGDRFLLATGVNGLYGRADLYNADDKKLIRSFTGHRDTIYDAVLSPDGQLLATCSYDASIILWNVDSREIARTIRGHHGAVFDLAFSPDGMVLASASADETIKLWSVKTGERLDTLSQPEAEQFAVTFSPDGRLIVAGGADNRIRVWKFVSHDKPRINPLVHTRFAHQGAIVALAFTSDGSTLVSSANDRTIKLWETDQFAGSQVLPEQSDVAVSLATSVDGKQLFVGRLDGSWQAYPLAPVERPATGTGETISRANPAGDGAPRQPTATHQYIESEPNDPVSKAQSVDVPAAIEGTIHADSRQDVDLYSFSAVAGESWMVEINASRSSSPLDSKLEILSRDGKPVPRVMLQAVRESYFTFRGKNSTTADDFRLHNWQDMSLDDYLYASGEVVKLWLYPRGPDSGFMVYPGEGNRWNYFDTSAVSHALNEPCWIVRRHPPGTELVPNGLPVFTVNFENDDDSRREWGTDSRLTFTAPDDGLYLVRVSDVRGFSGEAFKYTLTVRRPHPDFTVTCNLGNETIPRGSGREFRVTANRVDGFDGDIRVDVEGLPQGFEASSPVVIQAGQLAAYGVIYASENATPPGEDIAAPMLKASANVNGRELTKEVTFSKKLKLGDPPKVKATVMQDGKIADQLVIAPGQTISAVVVLERNKDFNDQVHFGNQDAGRNLPHGVYVDNIGLNGLLVTRGNSQREFFITAVDHVPETSRLFHLKARVDGDLATRPVLLHVRREK